MSSLGSVYDPQVQSVQSQIAALPQQQQNDQSALQGQQTQAFTGILNDARARGTGVAFGGIPLGEQAQYNATTYMPAAANLRASYNAKAGSLQDAINSINQNRFSNANSMYQFGVAQDANAADAAEKKREFDTTLASQNASSNSLANAFSGFGNTPTTPVATPKAAPAANNPTEQDAYNFIQSKAKQGQAALVSDFNAALKYYQQTGNNPDFVKLGMYQQMYPNLFGSVKLQPQGQVNTATYKATF